MDIACGVGVPLKIDNATINGDLGHFARLLIEVDLSTDLPDTLTLERIGKSSFVDVIYENLLLRVAI